MEKPRQNSTYVIVEVLVETGHEYMGPPFHVQIPPLMAQPAVQYLYQGLQFANSRISFAYPEAPSTTVVPQHAYPWARRRLILV